MRGKKKRNVQNERTKPTVNAGGNDPHPHPHGKGGSVNCSSCSKQVTALYTKKCYDCLDPENRDELMQLAIGAKSDRANLAAWQSVARKLGEAGKFCMERHPHTHGSGDPLAAALSELAKLSAPAEKEG